jgi:hypothetical protein
MSDYNGLIVLAVIVIVALALIFRLDKDQLASIASGKNAVMFGGVLIVLITVVLQLMQPADWTADLIKVALGLVAGAAATSGVTQTAIGRDARLAARDIIESVTTPLLEAQRANIEKVKFDLTKAQEATINELSAKNAHINTDMINRLDLLVQAMGSNLAHQEPRTREIAIREEYGHTTLTTNNIVTSYNSIATKISIMLSQEGLTSSKTSHYYFLICLYDDNNNERDNYKLYNIHWDSFRDFAGPLIPSPGSLPIVLVSHDTNQYQLPYVSLQRSPIEYWRIDISPNCAALDLANRWLELLGQERAIAAFQSWEDYKFFFEALKISVNQLSDKARRFRAVQRG